MASLSSTTSLSAMQWRSGEAASAPGKTADGGASFYTSVYERRERERVGGIEVRWVLSGLSGTGGVAPRTLGV